MVVSTFNFENVLNNCEFVMSVHMLRTLSEYLVLKKGTDDLII